jgi:hypothetical protein
MGPAEARVPLFIDRLPFHCWTDSTQIPAVSHWTIVLPIVLTEPTLPNPPSVASATDWALDTGRDRLRQRHDLGLDARCIRLLID